jgi:Relaxase/Mobilisation nuclease domain
MNTKGKSRAGAWNLAEHLMNAETNETIKILAVVGTVAQDLHGAFQEMEAAAIGTRCVKPLYHMKISPDPHAPDMTIEQAHRSVKVIMDQMGLNDHPYALVMHEKYGQAHPDVLRRHFHVVFGRINPETMLAMHDGHNYRQHELISRQLEKEFGHPRVQGAHVEREGVERPERTPPDWMMLNAAKSGIPPRDVADTVKQLWQPDDPGAFIVALQQEGLTLARGRRDLVILDAAGDVHTLARCFGVKVAEVRKGFDGIDRSKLPTVEEARPRIREHAAQQKELLAGYAAARAAEERAREIEREHKEQAAREAAWEDAVANAAIAKEEKERRFVEPDQAAPDVDHEITLPTREAEEREYLGEAFEAGKILAQRGTFAEPKPEKTETRAGGREKENPVTPQVAELIRTAPQFHIEDAARETTRESDARIAARPLDVLETEKNLKGAAARILHAYYNSWGMAPDFKPFDVALDELGVAFAITTKEEADRSHRQAEFARAAGNYAPRFKDGEIVIVTAPGSLYRHHQTGEIIELDRVQKIDQPNAERFLLALDRRTLQGIEATKQILKERADERREKFAAARMQRATETSDTARTAALDAAQGFMVIGNRASRFISTALGAVGKLFDMLFELFDPGPPKTRAQIEHAIEQGERYAAMDAKAQQHEAHVSQHERIQETVRDVAALEEQKRRDFQRYRGDDRDRDRDR